MRARAWSVIILVTAVTVVAFLAVSGALSQQAPGTKTDITERGKYIVSTSGCHDCHSPKVFVAGLPMPDTTVLLSGYPAAMKLPQIPKGIVSPDKWGALATNDFTGWYGAWGVSYAANLTPDSATGIGSWTEDGFMWGMRSGKHLGVGRDILPPMPWPNLAAMTDDDLKAVFAYLKSLKPIVNKVPAPIPPQK